MKKRVPVSQIMSTDLITVTTNQSLYDVERLLNRHNIRHIPVVEGDRLVGVISRSDLLRISFADLTENEENVEAIVYDLYTIQIGRASCRERVCILEVGINYNLIRISVCRRM